LDLKNKEIFDKLQEADGERCVSYAWVGKWAKAFRDGRASLADDTRSGRSPIPDGVERIRAQIECEPYQSGLPMARDLCLSKTYALEILTIWPVFHPMTFRRAHGICLSHSRLLEDVLQRLNSCNFRGLLFSESPICRLSEVIVLSYQRLMSGLFCLCDVKWLGSVKCARRQGIHLKLSCANDAGSYGSKSCDKHRKVNHRLKKLTPSDLMYAGNPRLLSPFATLFPLLSLSVVIISTFLVVKSSDFPQVAFFR
jgi:hypothetical protein